MSLYAYLCFDVLLLLISREHALFYWYQEHLFKNLFMLKKKGKGIYFKNFGIKSMFIVLCMLMLGIHCIYLLFFAMHELRGSFFEALL